MLELAMFRRFALIALSALAAAAQVKITREPDRIAVEINGKPFTALYYGPGKPYLHPLRAASGRIVTRMYPMEKIAGEPHDHPHHRGLWFSHGNVNGFDFWGNDPSQKGPKTGTISVEGTPGATSGKKSGTIRARFAWLDPSGKRLLTENRSMTFYAEPDVRTVDLDIELVASEPVTFGDTKEGTFAIRLAKWLEEPNEGGTATMLDADARKTEAQIWGKRSKWVDYSGHDGGEALGIAVFDHPSNPRHPTWWHARAYGLFAANIFGWHDFERDNSKNGELKLAAGEKLRFRYRVFIHPGDARSAGIEKRYADYCASVR